MQNKNLPVCNYNDGSLEKPARLVWQQAAPGEGQQEAPKEEAIGKAIPEDALAMATTSKDIGGAKMGSGAASLKNMEKANAEPENPESFTGKRVVLTHQITLDVNIARNGAPPRLVARTFDANNDLFTITAVNTAGGKVQFLADNGGIVKTILKREDFEPYKAPKLRIL